MVESMEDDCIRGLLENKVHFLEELLVCSKMLTELTYENHENEYDSLLETRERCIETLNSIRDALQNELQLSGGFESARVFEDNEAYAILTAQAKNLIREILILDEQNKVAITAELESLKKRINTLNCGRKGINGYQAGQRINAAGIYTDSRK